MSFRIFNGVLVSSACRFRLFRHADDMTKFASGYLQLQQKHYHSRWHHPSTNSPLSNAQSPLLHLGRCPASLDVTNFHCLSQPASHAHFINSITNFSTNPEPKGSKTESKEESCVSECDGSGEAKAKPGIIQRFKRAYREHGKVLVGVHLLTSSVWYSCFYAAARCGLDVVPTMEQWGLSDTIISPFRAGGLGDFAIAYLMYKVATPARYTVTLGGTQLAIRYLRSTGYMAPKSQEDSFRELYKDGKETFKNSKLRQERLKRLMAAREKRKEAKKLKKAQRK